MSFSVLYAIGALPLLAIVFGIVWKLKGIKTALIATGITLVIEIAAFVGLAAAITSVMPN